VREILRNCAERDVRFVVVTSGERILGLGDLGANGMGIPIGKLTLYTAIAGVPPQYTLPIMMDYGTNNENLLRDPLYIGLRRKRPSAAEVDDFVEEFVSAIESEFPDCCIQWEDWARADAFRLLARYRDRICSFNDDIQGSGAVVLAGLLNAMHLTGGKLAYRWSQGRAIFASGSPFGEVRYGGRQFIPGQRVTDELFIEAARALAQRLRHLNWTPA
jgi:malate dehydrogenase (oxaloacetate-decarboxylating)(NADP+)